MASEEETVLGGITSFEKSETNYRIRYKSGEYATLNILNNHVFCYYMSPNGEFLDYPIPHNATDVAKINIKPVEDYSKVPFDHSTLKNGDQEYIVQTNEIKIIFHKIQGTFTVYDKRIDKLVLKEHQPIHYNDSTCKQTLQQSEDEHFFGGGMQNGRFTHKGEIIHIVNTNNWVDGGVTSPNPFYWSSNGYGVLRNTWQVGCYDFGSKNQETIEANHNEGQFDAFFFINAKPKDILNDYYELTGRPVFMPEYALYEAHLNTFNRDFWVEVSPDESKAILFEDGKYYKSYKPNEIKEKQGILESLNGENNNYQFSARAMIDRYKRHDMPLGWFVPNDGYGSGYAQTDSLAGDIENLRSFVEYAKENGVEVALWTESCLEPKDPEHPKKGERDLSEEVNVGTVALKCDVAWIGDGYSFGLNAVENATNIFVARAQGKVRPLIIMVDGWAGTQRYSGIWSGDQTGGKWEYIRFHIPTYIGAGLSGLPIVGSDMDGIYGGGVREVNIRDFQWKTFTPLQLNMDGWGNTQKTPFSFDDIATRINRAYLKLKSMLLPYNYTIAHESTKGLPMIRAMFLEFPEEKPAYTKDSQYQFMWGPNMLVVPVYEKPANENGPVRNWVYLPDPSQVWIDIFTGDKYQGGKIYNNIETPLWKIPVFIRDGAIIPSVDANNNPNEIKRDCRAFLLYPNGESMFKVYEDDGKSSEYLDQKYAKTTISIVGPASNGSGNLSIYIHKTTGNYKCIVKERQTILKIMASENVESIKATINQSYVNIQRVKTQEEFENRDNVYYFDKQFIVNPYLEEFDMNQTLKQKFLLIKLMKTDVTESEMRIKIKGYSNKGEIIGTDTAVIESLKAPKYFTSFDEDTTATSITLRWKKNDDASYYEIERDGDTIFSNILGEEFTFNNFKCESKHGFRIRSVNDEGVSKWSYAIVVETKEEPVKNTVKDVTVFCSIPCQKKQEVCNLTKTDCNWWHTDWNKPWQAHRESGKKISLSFDLNDVYPISKIEYTPREDAGNGTFLKVQYRHSVDRITWTEVSPVISWERNETAKVIDLKGAELRYFEFYVLESVGGFGSGRNMLFYKKI